MSTLTRALLQLTAMAPRGSEPRRAALLRLARESGPSRGDEQEPPAKSQAKGPGKLMLRFLEEVGDRKTRNPDTGNIVKIRTLSSKPKDTAAHKLFLSEFERWKKSLDKKEDGGDDDRAGKEEDVEFLSGATKSAWVKWQNVKVRSQWSPSQVEALRRYTGPWYRYINQDLRAGVVSKYDAAIKQLDTLFDSPHGKLSDTLKVQRGITGDHPLAQLATRGDLEPGTHFTDSGYQSTSIRKDQAWLDWGDPPALWLHITVPKGARAVYLGAPPDSFSGHPEEKEVLLDRGTKVVIDRYDESTRTIHAHVEK